MASPLATEQPTIHGAWQAFWAHVPTILLIWLATAVLSGVGVLVYLLISLIGVGLSGGDSEGAAAALAMALGQIGQLPFVILSSLVGVLFVAVPALYYESGEVIGVTEAFAALMRRPWRYLLAGILFALVCTIGFLFCIVPGVLVVLVMPVYVNRIFVTNLPITDAFAGAFQSVYRSPHGLSYVGLEILAWLLVVLVSICTCGLGALLAVPVSTFYLQNAAYHKGVIS
jgi:hypothetical protein